MGATDFFELPVSRNFMDPEIPAVVAPPVVWGVSAPIPLRIRVNATASAITYGSAVSIAADLIYAGGDVLPAAQDPGTVYLSSNPDLATVSADGVVTVASRFREGDVVIIVGNQGVVGTITLPIQIPAHQDSDGDGMPDRWELLYRFDPQDPGDAALDFDGDGLTNRGEFLAGTNPLRPDTDADGLSDGSDPEPLIPESEPPQVALTAPLPGSTLVAGAEIAIAGSAVDNAVVRRITVFLDGLPVDARVGGGTFAFAVPTTGLEGVRRVEIRAVDAAGNIGAAAVDVEILPAANRPPVVDAGADQTVTGSLLARLAGAVTDDGLPNPPGVVTIDWRLVTGPGSAEIATSSQAVTDVVVSEPGTYRFALVASDSVLTASDVVDVTFNELVATQGAPDDRIHLISRRRAQEDPLANAQMGRIAMTPDGRWVAFATGASNLVADDGNASDDCFLWDRTTRRIERVSLPDGGPESRGLMIEVSLSDDASRVAFLTDGDSLIPGDTNRDLDLLMRDRVAGRTLPVAVGGDGALPSAGTHVGFLSGNGRFAVFLTWSSLVPEDVNRSPDVYVRDVELGVTELISVNPFGTSGNGLSRNAEISRDGRYVVFTSSASDLVDGDANEDIDVFVRDRWSGTTTLISRGLDGFSANGRSDMVRLSADGSTVAFESTASSLVAGDGNGVRDVFLYALTDGSMRRIVLDDLGHDTAGNLRALSGDGRRVLLERGLVSATGLVVRDVEADQSFPVSAPPGLAVSSSSYQRAAAILSQAGDLVIYGLRSLGSMDATIMVYQVDADAYVDRLQAPEGIVQGEEGQQVRSDAAGRFVAFTSSSPDLVDNDGNGAFDVFVFDRRTGVMERVSVASDGTEGDGHALELAISGDSRFVAFSSTSGNLVAGTVGSGQNVFVHDRDTGETRCVSIRPDGLPAGGTSRSPSISGDGRWIVFSSTATDLVADDTNGVEDVFLHDCETGSTHLVSRIPGGNPGNGRSWTPAGAQGISADGQWILFLSAASDLVVGDTNGAGVDVVLCRRDAASLEIVSRSVSGGQVANVDEPGLSPDGSVVVFRSYATGVVSGDTGAVGKIYLRDLVTGGTIRVTNSTTGGNPNSWSFAPAVSADGRFVIFYSRASNLVMGDTNGESDAFVHDRLFGTTVRASVSINGWQAIDETSGSVWVSADGRFVFFDSRAYNLVPGLPPFAGPWAFGAPTPKGVSAGPDQHGEVNTAIALSGRAPSGATVLWSMVQGPEQPLIVEPALPATTAWFPEPGVYLLRLTATLGAISDADEAQITVVPPLAPDANN